MSPMLVFKYVAAVALGFAIAPIIIWALVFGVVFLVTALAAFLNR